MSISATILPNVTVGNEASIAARSVVTKDVPTKATVGGNPVRVIRCINPQLVPLNA